MAFFSFLLLYRNIVEIVVSFMIRPSVVVPPLDVHRSAVIDLFDVVLVYVHHVLYILYAESTLTIEEFQSWCCAQLPSNFFTSPPSSRNLVATRSKVSFPPPPLTFSSPSSLLMSFFLSTENVSGLLLLLGSLPL